MNLENQKLDSSNTGKIQETIGWFVLCLLWFFTLYSYFSLPAIIPTHFNFAGQADAFGSKKTLFIIPVIGTLIFVSMTAFSKFPQVYRNSNNARGKNDPRVYLITVRFLRLLKLIIITLFLVMLVLNHLVAAQKIEGLGRWFAPLVLIVILLPTSLYLVNIFRKIAR